MNILPIAMDCRYAMLCVAQSTSFLTVAVIYFPVVPIVPELQFCIYSLLIFAAVPNIQHAFAGDSSVYNKAHLMRQALNAKVLYMQVDGIRR
jgi:hypothetical protein